MSVWREARERLRSLLNSPSNATLRRLLTDQGSKHWKGYIFAFAMMGLIALTTSLSAWIIGQIVNKIFVGRDLKAVWEITAAIVVIYTVKGLATYGQQVILSRVGNSIVADVQRRIFDQMLRMKVSYYSRSHSSEFIARQSFIAQSASNVLNLLITTLSRDLLTIVGLVIVMVSQDPLLSLLGADVRAARGGRRAQDRHPRAQDHGERVPGRDADDGVAAGDRAGHPHCQGLHARELHAREAGEGDHQLPGGGQQARARQLAHQPDHGEPWRLRYRRRGALFRLHRHHPRQPAGEPLFLHHFGDHAL